MHENTARRIELWSAHQIFAASDDANVTNELRLFAPKAKLCRVVQNEHQAVDVAKAFACGLKMARKNLVLSDTRIREKSICGFGVRPILTRHRNRFTYAF